MVASAEHRLATRRFEVERWVAAAIVLLCFANLPITVGRLSVTVVVVLALAPVWLGSLSRFRGAPLLFWCSMLALGCGLVMGLLASPERQVAFDGGLDFAALVVTLIGRIGVLLWARTRLSTPVVAILAGVALVATVPREASLYSANPWKFGYALPVAVLTLAIVWQVGRRWLEIVALMTLVLLSAVNDSRSSSAILGLAVIVVAWQAVRTRDSADAGRGQWAGTALVLAGLGWAIYHLVESLILSGFLGQSTQQRTLTQLDASGSLLLGGRPEIGASLALMRDTPWGFGLGVRPSLSDILVAKSGMASLNYDPNNGYVEKYMFGGGITLHSIIGDLWANLGLGGVALCVALVYVGFRAAIMRVRLSRASALVVVLACNAAWAMPFGPFRASVTVLSLWIGLALIPTMSLTRPQDWDRPPEPAVDG